MDKSFFPVSLGLLILSALSLHSASVRGLTDRVPGEKENCADELQVTPTFRVMLRSWRLVWDAGLVRHWSIDGWRGILPNYNIPSLEKQLGLALPCLTLFSPKYATFSDVL